MTEGETTLTSKDSSPSVSGAMDPPMPAVSGGVASREALRKLCEMARDLGKARSYYDRMFGTIEFANVNADVSEVRAVLKAGAAALPALLKENEALRKALRDLLSSHAAIYRAGPACHESNPVVVAARLALGEGEGTP